MVELKPIDPKDLIFENIPLKDRINTKLTLQDTDWMNYILKAIFTTKRYGRFYVSFEFSGIQFSVMKVTLIRKKHFYNFEYEFSTDIFQKYIIQYLSDQIASWQNENVFYAESLILAFYNQVIKEHF